MFIYMYCLLHWSDINIFHCILSIYFNRATWPSDKKTGRRTQRRPSICRVSLISNISLVERSITLTLRDVLSLS